MQPAQPLLPSLPGMHSSVSVGELRQAGRADAQVRTAEEHKERNDAQARRRTRQLLKKRLTDRQALASYTTPPGQLAPPSFAPLPPRRSAPFLSRSLSPSSAFPSTSASSVSSPDLAFNYASSPSSAYSSASSPCWSIAATSPEGFFPYYYYATPSPSPSPGASSVASALNENQTLCAYLSQECLSLHREISVLLCSEPSPSALPYPPLYPAHQQQLTQPLYGPPELFQRDSSSCLPEPQEAEPLVHNPRHGCVVPSSSSPRMYSLREQLDQT
jgi:hypothetical protein